MYCIIYKFSVLENKTEDFIKHWNAVTIDIYQNEGSLGSRLHCVDKTIYIAYAQWPNQDIYEQSGKVLSEASQLLRTNMRACCSKIETLFSFDVVTDYLKNKTYDC